MIFNEAYHYGFKFGAPTFTFRITEWGGSPVKDTFIAEEGMTWYEWIHSDYNTIGTDLSTGFTCYTPSESAISYKIRTVYSSSGEYYVWGYHIVEAGDYYLGM